MPETLTIMRRRLPAATLRALLSALLFLPMVGHAVTVPDPTRPARGQLAEAVAVDASAPRDALVLQSTLVGIGQRSAILNGRRYRLGDRIDGAELVAIGSGWVRLRQAGQTRELRLSHSSLMEPVKP